MLQYKDTWTHCKLKGRVTRKVCKIGPRTHTVEQAYSSRHNVQHFDFLKVYSLEIIKEMKLNCRRASLFQTVVDLLKGQIQRKTGSPT